MRKSRLEIFLFGQPLHSILNQHNWRPSPFFGTSLRRCSWSLYRQSITIFSCDEQLKKWRCHSVFLCFCVFVRPLFRGACPSRDRTCESVSQSHFFQPPGMKWPAMVPYGNVWSCMVPYGPIWSLMVQYGTAWSHMVPYCIVWYCIALYGTIWSCLVPYGPVGTVWYHMVPYDPVWSRMVLYGPSWSHMVLYSPSWSHMVPYSPVW